MFADADFLVVTSEGAPIGRLYLDRREDAAHVIDIGFEPHWRGRGLGAALLKWVAADARRTGARAVLLSVAANNPRAHALYVRLGFQPLAAEGMHLRMQLPLAPGGGVS